MTDIKVCCIASEEEARLAIECGATILGLVSQMPSGPGVIDEDAIATIAAAVPPPTETFLLTSVCDAAGIIKQVRRCGTTGVQICDALPEGAHAALRIALPTTRLVQVVHVTYDEAMLAARDVDALLLDSGNPSLQVKELGGTGRVHDWRVSRRIVEDAGIPVFLGGGLNADNVGEALAQVQPAGVDICSGVRTAGRLDGAKLRSFVRAVRDSRQTGGGPSAGGAVRCCPD
jgi:phosphoribosylanthranilate isomerase